MIDKNPVKFVCANSLENNIINILILYYNIKFLKFVKYLRIEKVK